MKHLEILAIVAVAAAALMAFIGVGTAAAGPTELYEGHTTKSAGLNISASLKAGTTMLITDTEGGSTKTCRKSSFAATTTNTTAAEVTANVTSWTYEECTWLTVVLQNGSLDITYIGDVNGDGIGDGTLTGTNQVVTTKLFNLPTCTYGTGAGTHLGNIYGSTAGHALIDINATILEQGEKKALCPDTTIWDAEYTVTSPTGLNVRE